MMKSVAFTAAFSAAVYVFCGAAAVAQVQVVESGNRLIKTEAAPAPTPGNQGELFYQLQTLQQEVLELRGLVEEQAYELRRLKQQRLDDYLDLDRRISALTAAGMSPPAADGVVAGDDGEPVVAGTPPVAQTTATAPDEMQRYRTAIDLVLRKKDYEKAVSSFNHYLRDFPQGRYAANCQYWLGEIYLLQGDLEQAREWFTRLLNEHAEHGKAPDATYKLGTVYHKLGDSAKARSLLQQVAAGDSNAARLASSYLAAMTQ